MEKKRLHITLWPNEAIPVPAVVVPTLSLWDDVVMAFRGPFDHVVEIPEELYLRQVMQLDLEDPAAIQRFVELYGPLGQPGLVEITPSSALVPMGLLGSSWLGPDVEFVATLREEVEGHVPPGWAEGQWESRLYLHLDEFRAHARLLRDLVRIWRACTGDEMTYDQVIKKWESPNRVILGLARGDTSGPEGPLLLFLAELLNHALQPFRVHLEVDTADELDLEQIHIGRWQPTLFAALCLQLANHIAEGAVYRRCANERCGRLFFRQVGSAAKNRHRVSGVKYCSTGCAQAQAQREYRRNKTNRGRIEVDRA